MTSKRAMREMLMPDTLDALTVDARRERERATAAQKRLAFEAECVAFLAALAECRAACSGARQTLLGP